MELIGYIAAAFIGVSLGLIGGGGSILTVPVLVYLFGINPVLATSYSLFIVGITSFSSTLNNARQKLINYSVTAIFAITSVSTVFLTRKFIIPIIPQEILKIGNFVLTENMLMLTLFAILMIAAALNMIYDKNDNQTQSIQKDNSSNILIYGLSIGFITGLLGAGGGFLIIPTLVILLKIRIKEAIATSLFIISINSLVGFTSDLGHFNLDWIFLLKISALAILGSFVGAKFSKTINEEKLKKGFGWFVLTMGILILVKETLLIKL